MVVTHLSQALGFIAMERPSSLESGALHDAKAAVFNDLRTIAPDDVVYGQYDGYRDEDGVDPNSQTPTYAAVRVWIDKRTLARRAVHHAHRQSPRRRPSHRHRRPPRIRLRDLRLRRRHERPSNELVFDLGDDPSLAIEVRVKQPGPTSAITRAPLRLDVNQSLNREGLEAYQRLIHDVMLGDQLLFTRADEIEHLWARAERLLKHPPELQFYPQGSWGPEAADALVGPAGWALPQAPNSSPHDARRVARQPRTTRRPTALRVEEQIRRELRRPRRHRVLLEIGDALLGQHLIIDRRVRRVLAARARQTPHGPHPP